MQIRSWVAMGVALLAAIGCDKKGNNGTPSMGSATAAATGEMLSSDLLAAPADAVKTSSGLAYKVLQAGQGSVRPTLDDLVEVRLVVYDATGKSLPNFSREQPKISLQKIGVKGLQEGLQTMVVGEKTRFWIPASLGFRSTSSYAGNVVFDVELVSISQAPKPLPAPADVAAAPNDAVKISSGLAYRVLKKGTGKVHPKPTDTVKVHYTGWTAAGKMFDSSVVRGEPIDFPLNQVIKGWTEGVQLMVVGEKTRFWIPGKLAYGDIDTGSGQPFGMLVFDVELLAIR